MSAPENNTGVRRIFNAFFFSMHGLKACFRTEEAFRQEVYLAAVMIPAAFWVGSNITETVLLISAVAFVLIVEMLNTAVERAIDRISFEKHELSKEAKDMGSAAVFMALVLAGFIWAVIGLPKLF
ncbi:MAG: diacylglycerol kinase [Alphaproteobacteria bacterium]|nr:diacylglycerol kinase [Alphaproteobacteria bacterium]MCD8525727.1 diacylglycerol kinase [Alphaproteobacteria bacterium]MCD8570991.1 diacylglycerol kinase [Alphaproteobacteria bacterium]